MATVRTRFSSRLRFHGLVTATVFMLTIPADWCATVITFQHCLDSTLIALDRFEIRVLVLFHFLAGQPFVDQCSFSCRSCVSNLLVFCSILSRQSMQRLKASPVKLYRILAGSLHSLHGYECTSPSRPIRGMAVMFKLGSFHSCQSSFSMSSFALFDGFLVRNPRPRPLWYGGVFSNCFAVGSITIPDQCSRYQCTSPSCRTVCGVHPESLPPSR